MDSLLNSNSLLLKAALQRLMPSQTTVFSLKWLQPTFILTILSDSLPALIVFSHSLEISPLKLLHAKPSVLMIRKSSNGLPSLQTLNNLHLELLKMYSCLTVQLRTASLLLPLTSTMKSGSIQVESSAMSSLCLLERNDYEFMKCL